MGEKVAISYLVLGIYVTFVVVATLLVGLLPPLVNLPDCKPDKRDIVDIKVENQEHIKTLQEQLQPEPQPHREKREIKTKSAVEILKERKEKTRTLFESQIKVDPLLRQLTGGSLNRDILPVCSEISNPVSGAIYPVIFE